MFKLSNKGFWKDLKLTNEDTGEVEVVGKVRVLPMGNISFLEAMQKCTLDLSKETDEFQIDMDPNNTFYTFTGPSRSMAGFQLSRKLIAEYLWTDFKWDENFFTVEDLETGKERALQNTKEDRLLAISLPGSEKFQTALDEAIAEVTEECSKKQKKTEQIEEDLEKKYIASSELTFTVQVMCSTPNLKEKGN